MARSLIINNSMTDWNTVGCEYTETLRSGEQTIVIQLLMCSFGNDGLLAFFSFFSPSAARLEISRGQPQVSLKTSAGPSSFNLSALSPKLQCIF